MQSEPPAAPPSPRIARSALAAAGLAIALTSAFVYAPVRNHPFLSWDDPTYVTDNPLLRAPLDGDALVRIFSEPYFSNWHPLTLLSYRLDAALFGFEPGPYHVENVVLHVLTSLLLLWTFARATGALVPSVFVAAAFALHPLHVESVAWVSQRKDCLSGLFFAAAMALHAGRGRGAPRRRGRAVAVTLVGTAAMLAKPTAVMLPVALLLLDFWPLQRLGPAPAGAAPPWWPDARALGRAVREKLALCAAALLVALATWIAQDESGARELLGIPLSWRLSNAFWSHLVYLRLALWPQGLAYYYTWPLDGWLVWKGGTALLALTAITLLALHAARLHRAWLMGWLWYVLMLLPVAGFVQVGMQARADRYMYWPLLGLLVAAAFGLPATLRRVWPAAWPRLRVVLGALALAALVGQGAASRAQLQHWRSSRALYTHALEVTQDNFFAHASLARELLQAGRADLALPHFEEALRLRPRWYAPHLELAALRARRGELDRALALYERAAALRPQRAEPWLGRVGVLLQRGEAGAARRVLDEALEQVAPSERPALLVLRAQLERGAAAPSAAPGAATRRD